MKISLESILGTTSIMVSLTTGFAQILPAPTDLTCETLRLPSESIVTDPTPDFGWVFPQSGGKQRACRILVASQPQLLQEGIADLWDSGKLDSEDSVNVPYAGAALEENTSYWWQVKVWAADGSSSGYSDPQQFNTGEFDRSGLDYRGQSRWVELSSNFWVAEDKQRAKFEYNDPVDFRELEDGSYFIAYGKSVIGILEFQATAAREDVPITIHLGERKDGRTSVHKEPGATNIGYEKVEMLLKEGTHHYVVQLAERPPSHYLHSQKLAPHLPEVLPFRFVQISGPPEDYTVSRPRQAGLFYYFEDDASSFTSSDSVLNQVWDLCKYTLKATPFLGVYADGNRERMPYEADAYIQQLGHYSVDREYSIGKYTINFLLDHASWPTEWQMHTVMMAWQDYMYTGDASLLAERYEDFKRKTLIDLLDESGLISTRKGKVTQELLDGLKYPGEMRKFRDIVDWPQGRNQKGAAGSSLSPLEAGETDGYVFTDYNTVVNAFHYHAIDLLAKIAGVLGDPEEEKSLRNHAAIHKRVFLETFFDKERGIFRDGDATDHASLHANMFPLAFGMVPQEAIPTVLEFIRSRGMACSVYGAHYLLDALYLAGADDYAYELMVSKGKRSWTNMLHVGSTMTTEAWDELYKKNLTWNHAWGAAPANSVARRMVGIIPTKPGFESFRIAPQPGRLKHLSYKQPTIRGPIVVDLSTGYNQWDMSVSIPGNTISEVWIPAGFKDVRVNERPAVISSTETFAMKEWYVIALGPGNHTIVAN